jgi:hypothetical protein
VGAVKRPHSTPSGVPPSRAPARTRRESPAHEPTPTCARAEPDRWRPQRRSTRVARSPRVAEKAAARSRCTCQKKSRDSPPRSPPPGASHDTLPDNAYCGHPCVATASHRERRRSDGEHAIANVDKHKPDSGASAKGSERERAGFRAGRAPRIRPCRTAVLHGAAFRSVRHEPSDGPACRRAQVSAKRGDFQS